VVDSGLGKHSVVLKLRLAKGRSVTGEDNKSSLALADSLQGALVAKGVLARLDSEGKLGVNSLLVLLSFRGLRLVPRFVLISTAPHRTTPLSLSTS
jgi:hypothetical protein